MLGGTSCEPLAFKYILCANLPKVNFFSSLPFDSRRAAMSSFQFDATASDCTTKSSLDSNRLEDEYWLNVLESALADESFLSAECGSISISTAQPVSSLRHAAQSPDNDLDLVAVLDEDGEELDMLFSNFVDCVHGNALIMSNSAFSADSSSPSTPAAVQQLRTRALSALMTHKRQQYLMQRILCAAARQNSRLKVGAGCSHRRPFFLLLRVQSSVR